MPSLSRETTFVIVCGILSGSLFAFSSFNPEAGLMVMFMPLLPLAIVGLSVSARHCMVAALIAMVAAGVFAGPDYALFFTVLIVLPVLHLVRKALMWRGDGEERQWQPLLPVVAELTLMASVVIAGFILVLGHSEHDLLKQVVAQALHHQMDTQLAQIESANPNPKFEVIMKNLTNEWNFVIFACVGWLWVLAVYALTAVANMFLHVNMIALRPSFALLPGALPLWLPFIILVAGGLTFSSNANDHYLGQAIALIMVLPYFLSGIASVHEWARRSNNRWLWMVMFYILLLVFPALSVLVVLKGVHAQLESLLKRPPSPNEH